MNASIESPRRLSAVVIVGIWTVPAVLSCMQAWATTRLAGRPANLLMIGATQLPAWYLWAALTPALFRVADAAPPRWPFPRRSFAIHFVAWSICLALHATVIATAAVVLDPSGRHAFWTVWRAAVVSWIPSAFLLYCATIGTSEWMRAIEREKRRARAEAELNEARTQAELSALRSQLHPHFLFNALNTVAVLIRSREVAPAERVVTQLGAILRELLRSARSHETALANELDLLRRYLEIEQLRFGSALRVTWAVPHDCLDALVPVLVLQPLVENAVRHGIARLEGGGMIEISVIHSAGGMTLRVVNDGPAQDTVPFSSDGVGLDNTRRRLQQLYGARGQLRMTRHGSRTLVEVELPYHVAAPITGERREGVPHGALTVAGLDEQGKGNDPNSWN